MDEISDTASAPRAVSHTVLEPAPSARLAIVLLGGLGLAATLWFIVLPTVFQRYHERTMAIGQLDGRTASLVSLAISMALAILLAWGSGPGCDPPAESAERERKR